MCLDFSFLSAPLNKLLAYSQPERHFTLRRDDEHAGKGKKPLSQF